MRKEYKKPFSTVYTVKPISVICASTGGGDAGGHNSRENTGDLWDSPEEEKPQFGW